MRCLISSAFSVFFSSISPKLVERTLNPYKQAGPEMPPSNMSVATGDATGPNPRSMTRPKTWSEEVEEAYRFQLAGYRDEIEYKSINGQECDRWPHNGYVKKLIRKDGCWYYYDKGRECPDKEVHKTKLYVY